jgi:hypothetical protein
MANESLQQYEKHAEPRSDTDVTPQAHDEQPQPPADPSRPIPGMSSEDSWIADIARISRELRETV